MGTRASVTPRNSSLGWWGWAADCVQIPVSSGAEDNLLGRTGEAGIHSQVGSWFSLQPGAQEAGLEGREPRAEENRCAVSRNMSGALSVFSLILHNHPWGCSGHPHFRDKESLIHSPLCRRVQLILLPLDKPTHPSWLGDLHWAGWVTLLNVVLCPSLNPHPAKTH